MNGIQAMATDEMVTENLAQRQDSEAAAGDINPKGNSKRTLEERSAKFGLPFHF